MASTVKGEIVSVGAFAAGDLTALDPGPWGWNQIPASETRVSVSRGDRGPADSLEYWGHAQYAKGEHCGHRGICGLRHFSGVLAQGVDSGRHATAPGCGRELHERIMTDRPADQVIVDIESIKNMLVSRATGGVPDDREYCRLRAKVVQAPRRPATAPGRREDPARYLIRLVRDKLPRFLRTCRSLDEFWGFIQPKFARYAERRQFILDAFEPALSFLEQSEAVPSDSATGEALASVDSPHVQAAWEKALDRRLDDPEGAITAARALLETTCKHILDEEDVTYKDSATLPQLYAKVADTLDLAPSKYDEQVFKRILGGCQTVVDNLGALRNRLSDAHGKRKKAVKPAARHAGLAVNLAGTMASFLIETWETRGG